MRTVRSPSAALRTTFTTWAIAFAIHRASARAMTSASKVLAVSAPTIHVRPERNWADDASAISLECRMAISITAVAFSRTSLYCASSGPDASSPASYVLPSRAIWIKGA